ncbi:MAG: sugar ABC transporter substrate-binding protein [Firmicutes bacterium]|nr:sugar ABC transporter substrate-binding protein [Bacillota bacterium]
MKGHKTGWIAVIITVAIFLASTIGFASSSIAGTKIVVALRSLPETDYIMERVSEFKESTGVEVQFVIFPELELRQKQILDATTGAGAYDVLALDGGYVPEFAAADWIVPLNDYVDPKWDVKDILPKYRDFLSVGDKLYGLPVYGEVTHLMYRKDVFDAQGLNPPETIDEMVEIAKKLTNPPSMYGIAMRGKRGDGMNIYTWTQFLRSYGGDFWTDDGKCVFNSQAGIEATEVYADILREYGPPGCASYTWDDVQTSFMTGKVAMIIDASNFFTRIEDTSKSAIAGNIGYAMVPAGPAGRYPGIYAMGFSISSIGAKTEKERKAAAEFIQWATSKGMEKRKALDGIISVTRESVFNDADFQARYGAYNGWLESTNQSIKEAMAEYRPRIPEWREIGNLIGIAVEEAIAGIKAPEAALNEAAKAGDEVFSATRRR